MASLLRQIVAGPRAKHQETGLDLCYVTKKIIATSGPAQTYPQRAYRNPLDRLVAFLDAKHGDGWAIWEFRAEGTGYPDEAVYGRIRHYPWPDHHPPPFRLVPMIVAGMRNWLNGGDLEGGPGPGHMTDEGEGGEKKDDRVVVVHCKAGKGRSGSMACSYLIAECGWTAEDALARFTERRMRPKFGAGVSIPSQLRWISYVDRWTKGGKTYVDRDIEIVEVHVWGLRHGVKVAVEGFAEEGKRIHAFHVFKREERIVVEGEAPGGAGIVDMVSDMAGYGVAEKDKEEVVEDADYAEIAEGKVDKGNSDSAKGDGSQPPSRTGSKKGKGSRASSLMRKISTRSRSLQRSDTASADGKGKTLGSNLGTRARGKTITIPEPTKPSSNPDLGTTSTDIPPSQSTPSLQPSASTSSFLFADGSEPGGQAVIFKPAKPIHIPNSDVNISVERRNRAPASMGLTMVTAVAHVWFNTFFEGNGPEQDGRADDSGVFEIDWDKMDGIKGSSQKGTRACDRLSVVWRVVGTGGDGVVDQDEVGVTIKEPGEDSPVPQMEAADWKGEKEDPSGDKFLGLRVQDPESASVSRASSLHEEPAGDAAADKKEEEEPCRDDESLKGVKVSGPMGEEILDELPEGKAPGAAVSEEDKKADAIAKKGFIIE